MPIPGSRIDNDCELVATCPKCDASLCKSYEAGSVFPFLIICSKCSTSFSLYGWERLPSDSRVSTRVGAYTFDEMIGVLNGRAQ